MDEGLDGFWGAFLALLRLRQGDLRQRLLGVDVELLSPRRFAFRKLSPSEPPRRRL
jgi:hypothetical protein